MTRHNTQRRLRDLETKAQELKQEFFATGADDPTRPTRTELPDERAKSVRESAAKKALE